MAHIVASFLRSSLLFVTIYPIKLQPRFFLKFNFQLILFFLLCYYYKTTQTWHHISKSHSKSRKLVVRSVFFVQAFCEEQNLVSTDFKPNYLRLFLLQVTFIAHKLSIICATLNLRSILLCSRFYIISTTRSRCDPGNILNTGNILLRFRCFVEQTKHSHSSQDLSQTPP